jgi:hypothetical protein
VVYVPLLKTLQTTTTNSKQLAMTENKVQGTEVDCPA